MFSILALTLHIKDQTLESHIGICHFYSYRCSWWCWDVWWWEFLFLVIENNVWKNCRNITAFANWWRLVISEFCCYRFSHSIDIYIDSSNNCSDTSDTDSALGILKFPEEDYHSDIDFTGDGDDDEMENMDTMEIHFNLPASLTELQKKLFVRVYLWGRP